MDTFKLRGTRVRIPVNENGTHGERKFSPAVSHDPRETYPYFPEYVEYRVAWNVADEIAGNGGSALDRIF